MPTQVQYNGNARVHANRPLPSFLPPQDNEQSLLTNGIERTTSRRRRISGSGPPARSPVESYPQPPAPEVPKAPPVSYRLPYDVENYPPSKANYPSPSFSERARALTSNSITTPSPEIEHEPALQRVKPIRRGSLNRPIGGVYSEIQQHKRDSYPPPNGPVSPRRFSNPTIPQQAPGPSPNSQESNSATKQQFRKPENLQSQSSTRRASAGLAQAANKEWAPDRSPLQKLEIKLGDISKEEKRARVAEAEQRLRNSQASDKWRRSDREGDFARDRTSSRRASATTGERRSGDPGHLLDKNLASHRASPNQRQEESGQFPEIQLKEADKAARSRRRRESLTTGLQHQMASDSPTPPPSNQVNRNDSRRSSAREGRVSHHDAQPERGVRFQGQDGTEDVHVHPPVFDSSENSTRRRNPEIQTRPDQARKARPDKFRQGPSSTSNQSSRKEVPPQQKDLYSDKVAPENGTASAATYGGARDPLPRHAVQSRGQASNYEVPPQTAAGIHVRQAVGFGSGLQGTEEAPTHRKHHLSNFLHRGHDHAVNDHRQVGAEPKRLDEWRRAGTARLTAADFAPVNNPGEEHTAWWERGGSRSRPGSGRNINKEAQTLQRDYPRTTGKSTLLLSHQSGSNRAAKADYGTAHGTHTRQYMGEDEYAKLKDDPNQPHESHLTHFLHRSGYEQDRRLSSAYSYSCPNLAIHDPSHPDHICEPYLSKELTQSMRSIRIRPAPELATFDPPLYLKCGPLLRYTGLKRDRLQMNARSGDLASIERETWRGSVMIVTADADSSYDPVPTLRLFSEPMEILRPQLHQNDGENVHDFPSEYVDPVAGLPKLSRSGKTVYVKPVDDLEHAKDLSRLENDDGLFEETRTAAVPTAYGTPDFRASSANPKPLRREERVGSRGHRVRGVRLHAERGVTFWRFNLEVELGSEQRRIAYSINNSPSVGFWVPARGHSMNVMFHSCNGFSMSVM